MTSPKHQMLSEFARFSVVGVAGLLVDMAALYVAIEWLGFGYLAGRGVSYLAAATFTWACNRRFTFSSRSSGDKLGQWLRFLVVNLAGGIVNFAVYLLVVTGFSGPGEFLASIHPLRPYLGVALGSLAGLLINFSLSKLFVFRSKSRPRP